jgi:hypothetical protein
MTAVPPVSGSPAPSDPGMRWIYWVIIGLILILCVIGLITYSGKKETQEAQDKAQQLTQKLEQAGLPVPEDQDIIIRSLGADGGNVCDNPASALGKATLVDQITNGADFVGRRPVIIDRDVLLGEALILETYCPDKLEDYREKIDELKTDDTLKD